MSLKLIELQVAISRTQEFGKMTEQLNQRGQIVQSHLAISRKKIEKLKGKQVTSKSKNEPLMLSQSSCDGVIKKDESNEERTKHLPQNLSMIHPTKGKKIDFFG